MSELYRTCESTKGRKSRELWRQQSDEAFSDEIRGVMIHHEVSECALDSEVLFQRV